MEQIKVRGNFIGAAAVAIIYTVYILINLPSLPRTSSIILLIILNALTIILMYFAFSPFERKRVRK